MSEPIIISFSCANSEFASKLMGFYDKLTSEISAAMSSPATPAVQPTQYDTFAPAAPAPQAYAPQPMTAQQVAPAPQMQPTAVPPQQYAPQGMPPQNMSPQMQGMTGNANFNQATGTASAAVQYQQQAIQYDPVQTIPNNLPSGRPAVSGEELLRAVQLFSSASDANREIVRQSLQRFNADSFSKLSPAAYNDFAAALREKGARI